ncbi:MAG: hypothetical protein FJ241_13045 [Nitrospira sp.]|nr:hypothetical protein [Nitrospira sp.]
MKRVFWLVVLLAGLSLILVSCGSNAFKSLSDENSDDACRYKTTQNLDSGNYDAVLISTCANSMQLGAAYFGKAGYDIKDVINRLSEAQDQAGPLNIYMSSLTGIITDDTLTNLDNAKNEYVLIQAVSPNYPDAQFYVALVDAITSLSLMKMVIDFDGDGKLLSDCNINDDLPNNNDAPDDADALACALLVSGGQNCNDVNATSTQTGDITFTGKNGTYRGLTITLNGVPTQTCPAQYQKLLVQQGGIWVVATTSSRMCLASDGNQWPCPVLKNNNPLDLVGAIDTSITGAINALGFAIPGKTTDVQKSVNKIKSEKCCTGPGEDPNNVSTCTCTQSELAQYIRTIKR